MWWVFPSFFLYTKIEQEGEIWNLPFKLALTLAEDVPNNG